MSIFSIWMNMKKKILKISMINGMDYGIQNTGHTEKLLFDYILV